MDKKEWRKVLAEAKRQGWEVVPTSHGFRLLAPNGRDAVTMHAIHQSSSPRALSRTVSLMKRFGFRWPPSKS
jgi:hypothetical protein